MMIKLSRHALLRIQERTDGTDKEVNTLVEKAFRSEEISRELISITAKPNNNDKVVREFDDQFFVFGIRYNDLYLITVYDQYIQ